MKERFSLVPAVYTILRRDNTVLLIRRANTGYRDGFYTLPSGHIDGNEPAITAAARESKEEVGVDVAPQDLKFAHVVHRVAEEKDHERIDFFFEAKRWQGEPYNAEPDKCDDIGWFKVDDLPENTAPLVKVTLEKIAVGKYYSDLDF